jgi:hypothetical protein
MPSNIKLVDNSPEAVGKSPTASSSDKADSKYIIKLSHPYKYDDEEISELDMSGIEDLTGRDIKKAQSIMTRHGNIATVLETNVEFLQLMAAAACGKEVEFIEELNAKDTTRVKNWVSGYFLSIT